MRHSWWLMVVVACVVLAWAVPAAATTYDFRASFKGSDCGPDLCDTGTIQGFGRVTSRLHFTSLGPGPSPTCSSGTADRLITLDADGSTLQLAVDGTICGRFIDGTFSVVGGTGVFGGATGDGTLRGIAHNGEAVQYRGTLTLP